MTTVRCEIRSRTIQFESDLKREMESDRSVRRLTGLTSMNQQCMNHHNNSSMIAIEHRSQDGLLRHCRLVWFVSE